MSTPPSDAATGAPGRRAALFNTAIVAGGYALSRVLGLVREVIISAQFGVSPQLDAFRATFNILDLVYLVVAGGALGSAFIPIFAGFLEQKRESDAWRLASTLLNLALAALVGVCVLIGLLAVPLVALLFGGFDAEQQALTVTILRLMLLQPILLGLGGLAKATLESFDRFALPSIGSNLYNIGIIVGALLAPWLGIYGMVWGVVGGAALFLLVQLPGLARIGARYTPAGFAAPGLAQVGRLLLPRLFGQSVWQINMIAITAFATTLGAGAVSANSYAFQLMVLPHGLIALSLGTVIFPQLARFHAAGDVANLRATAFSAVRSVLFLALPAALALAVLRVPVLRALFQREAFDAASAALTAEALLFYALGLAPYAGAEILVRTFYAMRDTRTPVYIAAGAVVVNIALGWALLRLGWGLGGLALAFSISSALEAAGLLLLLGPRVGGLGDAPWAMARMALATLAAGAALVGLLVVSQQALPFLGSGDTYRWPADFLPLVAWLALAGGVTAAVYLGVAALLRLGEVGAFVGRARRVLRR